MKRLISGVMTAALLVSVPVSPANASSVGSSALTSTALSSVVGSSSDPISLTLKVVSIISILAKIPQLVTDLNTISSATGGPQIILPPPPTLSDFIAPGSPNTLAEPHHFQPS